MTYKRYAPDLLHDKCELLMVGIITHNPMYKDTSDILNFYFFDHRAGGLMSMEYVLPAGFSITSQSIEYFRTKVAVDHRIVNYQ